MGLYICHLLLLIWRLALNCPPGLSSDVPSSFSWSSRLLEFCRYGTVPGSPGSPVSMSEHKLSCGQSRRSIDSYVWFYTLRWWFCSSVAGVELLSVPLWALLIYWAIYLLIMLRCPTRASMCLEPGHDQDCVTLGWPFWVYSFMLQGIHEMQSVSLSSTCVSCQGLVQTNSSCLRLCLGCLLPLRSLVFVLGYPPAMEHWVCVVLLSPTCCSSVVQS